MLARQVVLLTSSESFHSSQLPSRQQSTAVNPLAATLMDFPASVANKRLTAELSPLAATFTKNRGGGGVMVNQLPLSSNVPTRLQPPFVLNRFHTLPSSVSCNSFACHSYENYRVCTNNSNSGTQPGDLPRSKSAPLHLSPVTIHQSLVAHPPVPNRTPHRPLPYAYNHCAILPPLCPGDRPFAPSWRSS